MSNGNRVTEAEVSLVVLRIAASRPDDTATFYRIRRELPDYIDLSAADRRRSRTRPNEQMWEQQFRNIKSHFDTPGNILYEGYAEHILRVGYRITAKGKRYLRSLI